MFDEQNQNLGAPKNLPTLPTGQAGEPVDMFAGVEKDDGGVNPPAGGGATSGPDALSVGLLKKKEEMAAASGSPHLSPISSDGKMSAPILGKILLFLAVFLLLGGLAYGGWWFFYGSKNKSVKLPSSTDQAGQNQTPQTSGLPTGQAGTVSTSASIPAQSNNDQILFGQAVDSDKDGLDNAREKEIGTDPQKADTDGDGLNDGDEVTVYKTSPLVSDTDGDGLSDGDEVLIWHSNPLNPDTDGDSYTDGEEVRNGYSPIGPGKLFPSPSTTPTPTTTI